jgi:hypothetical protein
MEELGFQGCATGGKKAKITEQTPLSPSWLASTIGDTTVINFSNKEGTEFRVRQCHVVSLPELFTIIPPSHISLFTAYSWWLSAHKIIKQRLPSGPSKAVQQAKFLQSQKFHHHASSSSAKGSNKGNKGPQTLLNKGTSTWRAKGQQSQSWGK